MRRILLYITILLMAASCEHKELCYDHSHMINVDIRFDWSKAPDADPETMKLYIYDDKGSEPITYTLLGKDGGKIRLTEGIYRIISFNGETEHLTEEMEEDYNTLRVTSKTTDIFTSGTAAGVIQSTNIPKAKGAEEERIAWQAEEVWAGTVASLDVNKEMQNGQIDIVPEVVYKKISIEINNVTNLQSVSTIRGTLSSLAGGYLPGLNALSEERVTVPFDLTKSQDLKTLTAQFLIFGHCPKSLNTHNLAIYTVLADGSKWYKVYDVSDQMHNSEDPYHIEIVLDGLPFPEVEYSGGGFVPEIDEWNTINIGIQM